ncbi:hypothetical protein [Deinococcus aquiradiocola]|uniref:Uncharacterized protein n=1 Tax=Deinococcus aquiradiocola TaxID=393059 RepID=A0A917UQZ1_9DEIO|nr:hypothetical protein [Deinococcus aquiradiocola]GGJ77957.1 hypothetical protein GCM10008939_22490 [Deinococcus aquiradiocola]
MPGTTAETTGPEILGVVKVEFQHIGQADFSVQATMVGDGLASQTLTRTGALSFTQGARGSFTGPDHVRYLYGQLNVNNTGPARSNLTLLGINAKVTGGFRSLGDTSLAAASRANGEPLTALEARKVLPLHRRDLIGGAVQVVDAQADFQAYPETAITPAIANFMAGSPYNGYAFPFGFVARSKTNASTRLVPSGTAAGTVTLAFRYPDEDPNSTSDDLNSFTWYGLVTSDTENRETADPFETDTVRACAAAQTLYGGAATVVAATLRNLPPTNCGRTNTTAQDVYTVRTSGRPGSPTTKVPDLTIAPSAGTDVVVFNDVNPFIDGAAYSNPNNTTLVQNLVNYTPVSGIRASSKTVWMEFGHGTFCQGYCSAPYLSTMKSIITSQGYTVQDIASATLPVIPQSVKVIFLWNPLTNFTVAEINALKAFSSEGGRIVFIGEWDGFYGTGISVENAFLINMGAVMRNTGGAVDCNYNTEPGTSLRPSQITAGLTNLTVACASVIAPGPDDFIFLYDQSNTLPLAGVARINTTPIATVVSASLKPQALASLAAPALNPASPSGY